MVEAKNIRSLDSIGLGSGGGSGGWKGSLFLAWRGSHNDKHGQSWALVEGLETAPLEIPKTPPAPAPSTLTHTLTLARNPTGNTGNGKRQGNGNGNLPPPIPLPIPVPDLSVSTRRPSSASSNADLWDEWA